MTRTGHPKKLKDFDKGIKDEEINEATNAIELNQEIEEKDNKIELNEEIEEKDNKIELNQEIEKKRDNDAEQWKYHTLKVEARLDRVAEEIKTILNMEQQIRDRYKDTYDKLLKEINSIKSLVEWLTFIHGGQVRIVENNLRQGQ